METLQTILYVEEEYNEKINNFIVDNYQFLVKQFKVDYQIDFLYLPKLLNDNHFKEVLAYNHPLVELDKLNEIDLNVIYSGLISAYKLEGIGCGLMSFDDSDGNMPDFIRQLSSKDDLIEQFAYFALDSSQHTINKRMQAPQMMELITSDKFTNNEEEEIKYLFGESAEAILRLFEKGATAQINELISLAQAKISKLSRIRITPKSNRYRIYLVDKKVNSVEEEIKMGPLPKTLFIFYLNHPEGVRFKVLSEYKEEIMKIYNKISPRLNKDDNLDAINSMVTAPSDSVDWQASAIKKAFDPKIRPEIASNYYITGKQGTEKQITLPRDMVIREDDLQIKDL